MNWQISAISTISLNKFSIALLPFVRNLSINLKFSALKIIFKFQLELDSHIFLTIDNRAIESTHHGSDITKTFNFGRFPIFAYPRVTTQNFYNAVDEPKDFLSAG